MSSKPVDIPLWDVNSTHVTPIVAAHRNDGYGTDEVPASDELNEYMREVGQWCKWMNEHTLLTTQTIELAGADFRSITGSNTLDSDGVWNCATTFELVAALVLPAGARIDSCIFSHNRNSASAVPAFVERLYRRAAGTVGALTPVIDTFPQLVTGDNWNTHDIINSGNGGVGPGPGAVTIAAGFRYWLSFAINGIASGAPKFDGVKIVVSYP